MTSRNDAVLLKNSQTAQFECVATLRRRQQRYVARTDDIGPRCVLFAQCQFSLFALNTLAQQAVNKEYLIRRHRVSCYTRDCNTRSTDNAVNDVIDRARDYCR